MRIRDMTMWFATTFASVVLAALFWYYVPHWVAIGFVCLLGLFILGGAGVMVSRRIFWRSKMKKLKLDE